MKKARTKLIVDGEISLKMLTEEDVGVLFELINANREYLKEFLNWLDHNKSTNDTLSFIQKEKEKFEKLECLTFGIFYLNKLVGVISLQNIEIINKSAAIGYWISEKEQGMGIITRAATALIQYAFLEIQLHRIELRCAKHNYRSKRIAEKLGFIQEGLLKEAISHYGVFFDAYIFGKIKPI